MSAVIRNGRPSRRNRIPILVQPMLEASISRPEMPPNEPADYWLRCLDKAKRESTRANE